LGLSYRGIVKNAKPTSVGKVPALNFDNSQFLNRKRIGTRVLVVAICAALIALAATTTTHESGVVHAQRRPAPKFHVIALAEPNSIHKPFVDAAKGWLGRESMTENFAIDYIANTEPIDEKFLAQYQLFIQLDYPPYGWTDKAQKAFIDYIEQGKGGWIGFHHAALLGEFDGYPMWDWFSNFMGGIRYKDYIATFVTATVKVEDPKSPVMKGLPATFEIEREEWYTWNKSPRPNVHVLATVDESTYDPDSKLKMGGDHPVVWSNENVKARNVYIFMGHRAEHFKNPAFTDLFHNAILWAAGH
jgi:type 1 glutamine amidotransferase